MPSQHADNRRYASTSATGKPGLEVGFHVPAKASGRVITKLGRQGDLILSGRTISAVHVAFEIHPQSEVVVLSVRAKSACGVRVGLFEGADEGEATGDCVIIYGQTYTIDISSHKFRLYWWLSGTSKKEVQALTDLVLREYQDSLQRALALSSRFLPTEVAEAEDQSWHNTRIHTAKATLIREVPECRIKIGSGGSGTVFKSVDRSSARPIAVKVIDVGGSEAEMSLHREIKALEKYKHANIIEYYGVGGWLTNTVTIFMPLRDGSLDALVARTGSFHDGLCREVLFQMLQALDFLASHNQCHRDVKPQNILYSDRGQGSYLFQLADFGLTNHAGNARTFCGTDSYMAPELFTRGYPQTPKMDVWSLFATIIAVDSRYNFPLPHRTPRDEVVLAVQKAGLQMAKYGRMARENPAHRASAAQMLVAAFEGRGLSTKRTNVPPLEAEGARAEGQRAVQEARRPRAKAVNTVQPLQDKGPFGHGRKRPAATPLMEYPAGRRGLRNPFAVGPSNPPPPEKVFRRQVDGVKKRRVARDAKPKGVEEPDDAKPRELKSQTTRSQEELKSQTTRSQKRLNSRAGGPIFQVPFQTEQKLLCEVLPLVSAIGEDREEGQLREEGRPGRARARELRASRCFHHAGVLVLIAVCNVPCFIGRPSDGERGRKTSRIYVPS